MRAIAAIIGLVVLIFGYSYATGPLHLGAPDWYANYPCPAGSHLKTWWVPAGQDTSQETDVYHGWQEVGGCAGTLTITGH